MVLATNQAHQPNKTVSERGREHTEGSQAAGELLLAPSMFAGTSELAGQARWIRAASGQVPFPREQRWGLPKTRVFIAVTPWLAGVGWFDLGPPDLVQRGRVVTELHAWIHLFPIFRPTLRPQVPLEMME